jgi:hypothetical protein
MKRQSEFSLCDLYAALDAERQARGLSWSAVTRQINRSSARVSRRGISVSTVTGIGTRAVAEGDGVLQMLRWLNRAPEDFLRLRGVSRISRLLPPIPEHRVLRFDTKKIYAALDDRRAQGKMTWAQVAKKVGVGTSTLTHLREGSRTYFPHVMRIMSWLETSAAIFVCTRKH